MTQICAICIALLKGDVLTIGDGFNRFNCTNLPRELSRSVEQKFGVEISKTKVNFKSKFDNKPGYFYKYRLNRTEYNAEGISKMTAYCVEQSKNTIARTEKEVKEKKLLDQIQLF